MIFHSLTFGRSRGTLRMLMNDKFMFDRYYCINSTKHCENEEKFGALYHIFLRESAIQDSGRGQVLII